MSAPCTQEVGRSARSLGNPRMDQFTSPGGCTCAITGRIHAVCDEHNSHSFKSDGLPAHRPWMHEVMSTRRQKISGQNSESSTFECTWYSSTHTVSAVSTRRALSFWILPVRPMTPTWFWGWQTGPTQTTLADGRMEMHARHVHISVQLLASLLNFIIASFSNYILRPPLRY